jgi:hypothetical protein
LHHKRRRFSEGRRSYRTSKPRRMSNAHLFVAVREASAGAFDVLGELGASANGGLVYLARELSGDVLVVLKLEPEDDRGMQYFLDVARELDASVPDVETRCPRCRAKLRRWARFCTQCGLDVSGEAPSSGEQASRTALREKVRAATEGQYEFLGDIPRSEGGGLVYFARDLTDGKIVALRLQRDMHKKLEVGVTRTLKAADEAGAVSDRGDASRPAVTIIQRTSPMRAGPAQAPDARLAGARLNVPSRPAGADGPARPEIVTTPHEVPTGRRSKVGLAKIAAVNAIALLLLLLLLLTQL